MIDLKKMSVLIVDDMDNMCKSIRGMLKVLNYGSKFRFGKNGYVAGVPWPSRPCKCA